MEKSSHAIIAGGRIGESNKAVRALQGKLLDHLKPYEDKLYQICDDNGEFGFHPLAPSVRFTWNLIPFEIADEEEAEKEAAQGKSGRSKKSQRAEGEELPLTEEEEAETA